MSISEKQLTALRTALRGDAEEFDRSDIWPAATHGNEFPLLVSHAFILAARRRFPDGYSTGDVIRFVGKLRSRNQGEYADVSASAAEQMLFCALRGEPMNNKADEFAKGYAQVAVLASLVSDLNGHQLDELLHEARELTDQRDGSSRQ